MSCEFSDRVEAHFERRSTLEEDRAMFAHLATCADCRAHYERAQLRERATAGPDARPARLGAALGLSPKPAKTRAAWAVAALAAAALAVVWASRFESAPDGFEPRGPGPATPTLGVYRLSENGPPERVEGTVHATDALAFDYTNPQNHQRLVVFAVAPSGDVFWYFPSWVKAEENPSSVALSAGAATHELTERVRHPLPKGALTLVAVFSDDELHVKQVEALLKERRVNGLEGPRRVVVSKSLEVVP